MPYGLPGAGEVDKVGADKWTGAGLELQWIEIEGPLNDTWPPESHRRIFGDLKQKKSTTNYGDRFEVISDHPQADAERILHSFARRAFRRAVTDDDVRPFIALTEAKLAEGRSFEQAVRCGLLGIMISPDFLFFHENARGLSPFVESSEQKGTVPFANDKTGRGPSPFSESAQKMGTVPLSAVKLTLDDFALANRLS